MDLRNVYSFITILIISGLFCQTSPSFAQVSISSDDSPPGASAGLDVNFSDKGFLPPRMSYDERNAIIDPAEGLIVFCTNCGLDSTGLICIFTNGEWKAISPCVTDAPVA
jgi:hypothetical protein